MPSATEQGAVDVGGHVVQFYETDDELIGSVRNYLGEGAVGIVIATEAHREALRDVDADLVLLDAAATTAQFMRDGSVDRDAFFEVVGGVVRAAAATGRPVRAYGEMVALLWEAGDVIGAIELETLWNELATEVPFSLYCAYRSESVAGHEHADALEHVCHLHSSVVVEKSWRFAADTDAPGKARRRVTDSLRQAGVDGALLANARLITSELAANAVRHARSPFRLALSSRDSTVRILVHDESTAVPTMPDHDPLFPSGRGMQLIAAIARRWGVDRAADGKVVWAELRAAPR
jgi:anti-sigma regulatory factor (Ser/Thr protein kinase)